MAKGISIGFHCFWEVLPSILILLANTLTYFFGWLYWLGVMSGASHRGEWGGSDWYEGSNKSSIREKCRLESNGDEGGIRNLQRCQTPGRTVTIGSEQQLCLHLLHSSSRQSKYPCPGILYVGLEVAVTVSHPEEQTCNCYRGNGTSIFLGGMRRKCKLMQFARK